jgi:phosphoribosylaminoimidazole-succinocarboxamide synthase
MTTQLDNLGSPALEGKSKAFYEREDGSWLMRFKPHLRSITWKREEDIGGTEELRMLACDRIFTICEAAGLKTHRNGSLVKGTDGYLMPVLPMRGIPIEWIARYEAAGSLVRLFPSLVKEGQKFPNPLLKYDFKQDLKVAGVDDPTLNESYICGLNLLDETQLAHAKTLLLKLADLLRRTLDKADIDLLDFKVEFGLDKQGELRIMDEVSQDCIRARDRRNGNSLTKDSFRQGKTPREVLDAYRAFYDRIR